MAAKIPLRLQGIDLRDTVAYDRIPPDLEELFWMANGGVSLAVVLSDDQGPVAVADAADWARRIAKHMPGIGSPVPRPAPSGWQWLWGARA